MGDPRDTGRMSPSKTPSGSHTPQGLPVLTVPGSAEEHFDVLDMAAVFDPVVGDTCRVCGCWDYDACVDPDRGPCGWAAPNLCDSHRARDLLWALWQMLMGRLQRRRAPRPTRRAATGPAWG